MKLFYFLMLCLPLQLMGQKVFVTEALQLKDEIAYYLIGDIKGKTLVLLEKPYKFHVKAFDKNLQNAWNKELHFTEKYPRILEVVPSKEGFDVVFRYRKKSNIYLKINSYDPAANLVDSATVANLGSYYFNPSFQFQLSEDKNIGLVYELNKQTELEAFMIHIRNRNLLWNKFFNLNNFGFSQNPPSLVCDNRGNLYTILERNNRKSKRKNHHIEITAYGPDVPETTNWIVDMQHYLNVKTKYVFDNLNKKLVGAGLYATESLHRSTGYFYLKTQVEEGQDLVFYHPFKPKYQNALIGKKSKKSGVPELAVSDLVLRRDGGILLIAEKKKIHERQPSGMGRGTMDRFQRYVVDYYYDDMFIASIHPDGKIHWENFLPKKQYSQDDNALYSSYFLMKTSSSLRLIFNDDIRNNNTVSEYVISPNGKKDRNSLLNTEGQRIKLRFRDALQITANEVLIPSENRNRLKIIKLLY